jgi:hypothetical protein
MDYKGISITLLAALLAALLLTACTAETDAGASPYPTLSQQQIDEQETEMKYYYDTYGDVYAALTLRDMFEAGQITQQDYSGAYAQAGENLSRADIKEYHKLSDALNCLLTRLSEKDLLKDRLILTEAMKQSPVLISMFAAQQQRDAVEHAIKTIDDWAESPDDGRTKNMETELCSGGLSCGARVYLYYYIAGTSGGVQSISADGQTYEPAYYLDNRLGSYLTDALTELLLQNNGQKDVSAETAGS